MFSLVGAWMRALVARSVGVRGALGPMLVCGVTLFLVPRGGRCLPVKKIDYGIIDKGCGMSARSWIDCGGRQGWRRAGVGHV
jgi:hypothetical protein